MLETGKVIDVQNNTVRVLITRHTACGDCGACQVGRDNLNMVITVENNVKAKKGDCVLIELSTENFLFASFIFYGIPLLALIFGIILSYYSLKILGHANDFVQLIASISGLFFLSISYIIIKKYESKFKKMSRFKSKIVRIVDTL